MVVIRNTYDGGIIKEFPDLDTLAGADLSYEDLRFADFRGMDLEGTSFEGAELDYAEFDDYVLDGYMIHPPDFTRTCFDETTRHSGHALM